MKSDEFASSFQPYNEKKKNVSDQPRGWGNHKTEAQAPVAADPRPI